MVKRLSGAIIDIIEAKTPQVCEKCPHEGGVSFSINGSEVEPVAICQTLGTWCSKAIAELLEAN